METEAVGLRLVDSEEHLLEVPEEREARGRLAAEARIRQLEEELAKRA